MDVKALNICCYQKILFQLNLHSLKKVRTEWQLYIRFSNDRKDNEDMNREFPSPRRNAPARQKIPVDHKKDPPERKSQ